MIAKQVKGRGFRGCLDYLLGKDDARLIGGNMLGETARELAAEFSESRKLRPNMKRAVFHSSLSLPPGERLTDDKWNEVAGSYLKQMGFEGSQYALVRHHDTDKDHVHIVASRIRMDGSYVSESKDYQRREKAVRSLEVAHGLTRVQSSREVERRAPSGGELRRMVREGKPSAKVALQELVDRAAKGNPTTPQFFEKLERTGVEVIPNVAKTGHVSGISYRLNGELMKGSDLGRGYTWAGIQKRGVKYEHDRDREAIGARHSRELERASGAAGPGAKEHRRERVEAISRRVRSEVGTAGGGDVGHREGKQAISSQLRAGHQGDKAGSRRGVLSGEERSDSPRGGGRKASPKNVGGNAASGGSERSSFGQRILDLAASLRPRKRTGGELEKLSGQVSRPRRPGPERGYEDSESEKMIDHGKKKIPEKPGQERSMFDRAKPKKKPGRDIDFSIDL